MNFENAMQGQGQAKARPRPCKPMRAIPQDLAFLRDFGSQLQSIGNIEPLSEKRQTFF